MRQVRQRTIATIATLIALGIAFLCWRQSPDQVTRRLLLELKNLPGGHIDIFYFGRSSDEVQEDFDRLGASAYPGLIRGLKDPDPSVRYLAAGQLGRLGDRRAVEPLIASLNDRDVIVRYWAASALGEIGDDRAVEPLVRSLESDDGGMRFRAAQALGAIGDARAFEPLIRSIDDPHLSARAHVAEALGKLGDDRGVDPLIRIVESDDYSWVRALAAEALGRLGDRRALPALSAAAVDPSPQVSEAAKEATASLSHKE